MHRAVIIAKGDVQRVGYRDAVEEIARKLRLVGYVENLKPYDVRVVAEGEKEQLENFIEKIKITGDPLINVEDVIVTYEKPTGEFEYFEIRRGPYEEENAERLDLAAKHLKGLARNVKTMDTNLGEKIDNVSEKIDKGFENMGGKIDNVSNKLDSFHQDTVHRFDNLDVKYGRIADNMEKILKEMKEERKDFRESIEKILKILISQKSKSKA